MRIMANLMRPTRRARPRLAYRGMAGWPTCWSASTRRWPPRPEPDSGHAPRHLGGRLGGLATTCVELPLRRGPGPGTAPRRAPALARPRGAAGRGTAAGRRPSRRPRARPRCRSGTGGATPAGREEADQRPDRTGAGRPSPPERPPLQPGGEASRPGRQVLVVGLGRRAPAPRGRPRWPAGSPTACRPGRRGPRAPASPSARRGRRRRRRAGRRR